MFSQSQRVNPEKLLLHPSVNLCSYRTFSLLLSTFTLWQNDKSLYLCAGNSFSFWSPKCLLKWNVTLRFFIDTSKNLFKYLLDEFNLNFYNNFMKRLFWYKCKFAKYLSHYRQLSSQHHSSFLPTASRVAIKVSILGDYMAFPADQGS